MTLCGDSYAQEYYGMPPTTLPRVQSGAEKYVSFCEFSCLFMAKQIQMLKLSSELSPYLDSG